jgi:hypothetical protein
VTVVRPVLAVAFAGLLALAGCSDRGGEEDAAPTTAVPTATPVPGPAVTTTTTTPPSPTTTMPPSPTNHESALTQLLLDEPSLAGFRRDDARLGAGPLDLEAAARAESDVEAERALLETRHFVGGSSRAWTNDDGDVVYLAVYRFADAAQASLYLLDGTETLLARGARPFDVPEIAGAVGFTAVDDDGRGPFTTHAVAFAAGDRWALAIVGSKGTGRTPEDARAVAVAQAARLG